MNRQIHVELCIVSQICVRNLLGARNLLFSDWELMVRNRRESAHFVLGEEAVWKTSVFEGLSCHVLEGQSRMSDDLKEHLKHKGQEDLPGGDDTSPETRTESELLQ